ncbi:MAG: sigma factor [Pedococcus sp.]
MSNPTRHGERVTVPCRVEPRSTDDLAALLALSAGGDPAAFAALYDATSTSLYQVVRRVVGEHGPVGALTQEAYLTIWLDAHTYRPDDGCVLTWLMRVPHAHALAAVPMPPPRPLAMAAGPLSNSREGRAR